MSKISGLFASSLLLLASISFTNCTQNTKEKSLSQPVSTNVKDTISPKQIPIWTTIPDSTLIKGTETYKDGMINNVSHPTMTIFSPKGNKTGVAVLVFPGGGYNKLAIDLEGSEICKWFASIGVTGILVKYRVPGSGHHYDDSCHCGLDPKRPLALQDAQRTMGLVRLHAKEYNIDPAKIGVMGFSAGGHLVADITTNYVQRAYTGTDDADKVSCRPDFGISFFPGHMTVHTTRPYDANALLPFNSKTPPTFILQAGNDPIDTIQNSLVYYIALKKAGVAAEYHVYAEGGHAFGYKHNSKDDPEWTKLPIAEWPMLVERWLHTIKMINN